MKRLTRIAAMSAIVLTAGFGLTACGDDDSGTKDNDTKSESSDKGEDSKDSDKFSPEDFLTTVAEAQADAGSSTVSFTMNASGMEITGTGQTLTSDDPSEAAMAMVMNYPSLGEMEIRLVEGKLYMSMGAMTQNKFVVIDMSSGPIAEQFGPMIDQMDPSKQFEIFEDALVSMEETGESEEIDGVDAKEYLLVLDTEKVLAASGESADSTGAEIPQTLEYSIFVGDDNLPRRMLINMMGMEMVMDFSNWGDDVDVEAPSADEISDIDPFAPAG